MIWVDVEDRNGTKYGDGPITDITEYGVTRRLDGIGRVSFSVPLATAKRDLLQPKRYIGVREALDDGPVNIVSGIIDDLGVSTGASGASLDVSADDLLRELTYRSVGNLGIFEDRDITASDGYYLEGNVIAGTPIHNDMPEIWDGDPATSYNEFYFTPKDSAYSGYMKIIYVGFGEPIDFLRVDLSRFNTRPGELTYQYFDGAWQDITIEADTTVRSTANGDIYWDHDGLVQFEGTPGWVRGGGTDGTLYYVRIWLSDAYEESTRVNINELSGVVRDPSTAGLGMILNYAPASWRLDPSGHQLTSRPIIVFFDGESVLEALVILTEETGDHFRLADGRSLRWMWADDAQYPVLRCVAPGDPVAVLDNDDVAVILSIQRQRSSYELVTRVYATGGRYGNDRLDLGDLADDMRAPYGFVIGEQAGIGWYLERSGSKTTYGLIEAHRSWSNIVPETSRDLEPAAEALLWAAYEWLRRYSEPQDAYTITCAKVVPVVRPGDRIWVAYHEYDDSGAVLDIEKLLYVLEASVISNQDGTGTHTFVASTVDVWPDSEAAFIVRMRRQISALDAQLNGLAAAEDVTNLNTTLTQAMATQLEVRNSSDVPLIRVTTADNGGRIGVPTAPGIDWDAYGVVIAPAILNYAGYASASSGPVTIGDAPVLYCNGTFTVNLPPAAVAAGRIYHVVNVGTGTITIDGDGSETINGATTLAINTQWAVATLHSNGTGWVRL